MSAEHPPEPGHLFEHLTIHDTAYGGYGVGRAASGKVVFVPFTVEGDVVSARLVEDKKSFCYADLVDVVTPSSMRAAPHCPYFGECGGCLYGHIAPEHQLTVKTKIIENAFRKQEKKVDEVISADPLRYRHRVRFRVQKGQIGFNRFRTNEFIPVKDCPVTKQSIVGKTARFVEEHRESGLTEISVFENDGDSALARIKRLQEGETLPPEPFDGLTYAPGATSGISFVPVKTAFGNVYAAAGGFFQSNRFLLSRMQQEVAYALASDDEVLELYAGSGFFTRPVAAASSSVTAVESDSLAVSLGSSLAIDNAEFIRDDVDNFIRDFDHPFSAMVVDPPRAGMSWDVVKFIKERRPETVVSVSCNPVTHARDVGRLGELYDVARLVFIEMFPYTHHIETVAVLKLKNA